MASTATGVVGGRGIERGLMRVRQATRVLFSIAIGAVLLFGTAATAAAGSVHPAAASYEWGWVTVRKTAVGTYTPAAHDRGNSSGHKNTVQNLGSGHYIVLMKGLPDLSDSGDGGIVHVTALGAQGVCSLVEWFTDGSGAKRIDIACYNADRIPAASRFSVSFLAAVNGAGRLGYAAAEQIDSDPADGWFAPDYYAFDSMSGDPPQIARSSNGRYTVTFPGLGSTHGDVQVSSIVGDVFTSGYSANPNGPAICNATSWGPSGDDLVVQVRCRNTDGDPEDTAFTVSFVQDQGLKGYHHGGVAYLWANKPQSASYVPNASHRFSASGQQPHVTRTATGRYTVTLPGMPAGGAVQVTGFESGFVRCLAASIRSSGAPQKVGVRCVDFHGHAADGRFSLSYEK